MEKGTREEEGVHWSIRNLGGKEREKHGKEAEPNA